MPDTRHPTTEAPETVHRMVRLRLYPGDAATGILLTAIAGACRHVWNHMLAPTRSGVIACGRPTGLAPSPFRPSSPW
ncbi:MAG: helix-turn-helix domain-containing protein, partial [Caldilineaceae bacterium]|nr:helix-turn-helix domain-containing protein [Caldilineaceae bacterium]